MDTIGRALSEDFIPGFKYQLYTSPSTVEGVERHCISRPLLAGENPAVSNKGL